MSDNGTPTTALARQPMRALGRGLVLDSMDGLVRYAQAYVESSLCKFQGTSRQKLAETIIVLQKGLELGISPQAALDGLYVVHGRVGYEASLMRALIRKSGEYDYRVVKHDDRGCSLRFFKRLQSGGKPGWEALEPVVTFTVEDAKRAGLLEGKNKATYSKWMRDMLFHRATARGARMHCPDLFLGSCYTNEEILEVTAEVISGTAEPEWSPQPREESQPESQAEAADRVVDEIREEMDEVCEHDWVVVDEMASCARCGLVCGHERTTLGGDCEDCGCRVAGAAIE